MRDPYKIVNHGKEAMDAAIELQTEIKGPPRPNSLNKYGWVYKTKEGEIKTINQGNQACYAHLLYNWMPKEAKALYFVDWANHNYSLARDDDEASKALSLEFAKWAATQSVWRRAFVTKDPEKLISGPSIFHTAHPIRFVIQAAMMLRYIYEKRPIIEMWGKFKKHVDAHAAFYLAHHFGMHWSRDGVIIKLNQGGHSMFDSGACDEAIVMHSLVTRDFSFMKNMDSTYEKAYGYSVLDKLWGPVYYKELETPPFTVDSRAVGGWGNTIKGWTDLESFAKETVKLNMAFAVERLAKLDEKAHPKDPILDEYDDDYDDDFIEPDDEEEF